MALAPSTVQRMPARFNRAPTTCLQPTSTPPEETHRPWARNRGQRMGRPRLSRDSAVQTVTSLTEIGDAVAQHRRLADEVRRTEAQLGRFERRAARQAERQRLPVAGAQVYGAVRTAWAPVSAAIEFESVMADVRKVVDFDTAAPFRAAGRAVLDLSTRIPMAAAGLGEIMAEAGQAGIAREELLRFTEDAANMGVAFEMSGQQAGKAMAGLRTIFRVNSRSTEVVGRSRPALHPRWRSPSQI